MQRNTRRHDTDSQFGDIDPQPCEPPRENEDTDIHPDVVAALRDHDDIEKVTTYDDHSRLTGVMVIIDWVTDCTNENGTRIIHDKDYNGQIRRVSSFIDELDGVRRTRGSSSGLARYTYHVEAVRE